MSVKSQLNVDRGSVYSFEVLWLDEAGDPRDLSTGWTAAMQVRESYDSAGTVLDVSDADAIALGADGLITVSLTDEQTETLATGVWDLELTNGDDTYRVAQGTLVLSPEVTQ